LNFLRRRAGADPGNKQQATNHSKNRATISRFHRVQIPSAPKFDNRPARAIITAAFCGAWQRGRPWELAAGTGTFDTPASRPKTSGISPRRLSVQLSIDGSSRRIRCSPAIPLMHFGYCRQSCLAPWPAQACRPRRRPFPCANGRKDGRQTRPTRRTAGCETPMQHRRTSILCRTYDPLRSRILRSNR